jgi:hypothetical protein
VDPRRRGGHPGNGRTGGRAGAVLATRAGVPDRHPGPLHAGREGLPAHQSPLRRRGGEAGEAGEKIAQTVREVADRLGATAALELTLDAEALAALDPLSDQVTGERYTPATPLKSPEADRCARRQQYPGRRCRRPRATGDLAGRDRPKSGRRCPVLLALPERRGLAVRRPAPATVRAHRKARRHPVMCRQPSTRECPPTGPHRRRSPRWCGPGFRSRRVRLPLVVQAHETRPQSRDPQVSQPILLATPAVLRVADDFVPASARSHPLSPRCEFLPHRRGLWPVHQ